MSDARQSNFGFVRRVWPEIGEACLRAESYVFSDPVTALIQARRAIEQLVDLLYDLYQIESPFRTDLVSMTKNPAFVSATALPHKVAMKLDLIRTSGNRAAHGSAKVTTQKSIEILGQLYDVMIWATFNHSVIRDSVPTGTRFDPESAKRAAALNPAQRQKLVEQFAAEQKAWAKQSAETARLLAEARQRLEQTNQTLSEKDAEIAKLKAEAELARAQLKQIQNSSSAIDNQDYNEAETRKLLIDELLSEAGWAPNQPQDREYPVTGMPISSDNPNGNGYVDYVLWGDNGTPLALVEAKRTSKSSESGQYQAKLYADALEHTTGHRPVIFYTNGYQHRIWDDTAGYPPREIAGFLRKNELELMVQRRTTRTDLNTVAPDTNIAGRYYQTRAIRAVDEAFSQYRRAALLVMATGSGKTRTAVALVDQLMRAGWVKNVLFLADRTALVKQAVDVFRAHLPSSNPVNLVKHRHGTGRVYVSTYPTMMNLINEAIEAKSADPNSTKAEKFGPGFFDLIFIDEAHRSVYEKYGEIFKWFDALLIGLTATPKDEVDRNTYRLFNLEAGVPTDSYSLTDAVADGYLVPPKGIDVGTTFLRQGIRYVDLSPEERDEWDSLDWGDDVTPPTEIGAEEINRFLFNEDTVEKVLDILMQNGHRVDDGERLAKTIIFAKNQEHAEFIQKIFDRQYPEFGGNYAAVITHNVSHAESLIEAFADPQKQPTIAISVDMLDTGIDVPDVANLVFFKTVRSKVKFWQMIGRGTRLCPGLYGATADKKDFFVFDFCGNLEFFSQELPEAKTSRAVSLTERLVIARVDFLQLLDTWQTSANSLPNGLTDLRQATADNLHKFIAGMNTDNFTVRPHRQHVERLANAETWTSALTDYDADVLTHTLASLPSAERESDVDALRLDILLTRGQIARLTDDRVTLDQVRKKVQEIAENLLTKMTVPVVKEQAILIEAVAGDEWWENVTAELLELARLRLRNLVRFIDKAKRAHVYTDFADTLRQPVEIELPIITPGVDFAHFRETVQVVIAQHQDHIAIQRLRRNRQLTEADLASFEQMLLDAGATAEQINMADEKYQGLGLFVRSIVGLESSAAKEAFTTFINDRNLNAAQIRFVETIIDELSQNGTIAPDRLYEAPFTALAPQGPELLFPGPAADELFVAIDSVTKTAIPVPA